MTNTVTPPFEATVIIKKDKTYVTLFPTDGGRPIPTSSDHPLWDKIWAAIQARDAKALKLASIAEAVANKYVRISERVTTKWGKLYFDGDEVDNSLTHKILELVDLDSQDSTQYEPWVKFLENVMTNPQEHSRKQLYSFLTKNGYVLTPDGNFIGYKGVHKLAGKDKQYRSGSAGTAIVNGELVTGTIPQSPGDIVEMPRSACEGQPTVACSTGLHVANFGYANTYGDTLVAVEVNPRDVVSVPTDGNGNKVRCCRYRLLGPVHIKISGPVVDPNTYLPAGYKTSGEVCMTAT